jgi:ATP/maltotriose-dependent transcriptional regulator MalT
MLAEELTSWPEHAWLMIDDFHLVMESSSVGEFVDLLLEACPVKVIATSRRRPGWATARRRLHGEILELAAESLAMTPEEAEAVLDGRSSEAIATVLAQAEGWPAVIGLAAIAGSAEIPRSEVVAQLYRYLAEEVLRLEPADIQAAVLRAAIPPTFDEGLCGSALEIPQPERLIDHLRRAGIVIEVEDSRVAFHPLLRSFLLRRQESVDPELARRLAVAALEHARSARRWAEAYELVVRIGTATDRAELVSGASDDLLEAGQVEMLEKWLDECGVEAEHHAATRLARAEILYRRGRLAEAEALARDIATSASDVSPVAARAWYLAGRAAHLRSRSEVALELHTRSESAATTVTDRSNALWGAFLASIELEQGADECLARLLEIAPETDLLRVRLATARTIRALADGRAREAHEFMSPVAGLLPHIADPTVRSVALLQFSYVQHARSE